MKFSRRTTAFLDWLSAHRIAALITAAFAVGMPLAWAWTGTAGFVTDAFVGGVFAGNRWTLTRNAALREENQRLRKEVAGLRVRAVTPEDPAADGMTVKLPRIGDSR